MVDKGMTRGRSGLTRSAVQSTRGALAAFHLVSYVPGMEKTWTVYRYEGRGKCRVVGRLVATETAIQEAIAQLAEEEWENVFFRPAEPQPLPARWRASLGL